MPDLSTGDAVRHATLGTGIVTRIEAGGVVTVSFEDGNERRLMLEYAPLERIAEEWISKSGPAPRSRSCRRDQT